MAYHLFRIALIALFVVLWPAGSAKAIDSCCVIIIIDEATGLVTAVNRNSDLKFEFTVQNEKLLNALRPEMAIGLASVPGSNVISVTGIEGMNKSDWGALVDGIEECCTMVGSEQFGTLNPQPGKLSPAAGRVPLPDTWTPVHSITASGAWTELAPGVRLEITNLQRVGPNLVTMTYIVTNGTEARINMASWGIAEYGSRGGSFNGIKLLDYQNGNVHPVIYDAGNNCRCSYGGPAIEAGVSKSFWAEYAAPPGDVDKVGIAFKNAPPLYGVPLSNQ